MDEFITIFMCGDVMTGRGIDHVMPYPSDPKIYEFYMKSAENYVDIAEAKNGVIQKPVNYSYIWGSVLDEMKRKDINIRLINLETSVTKSDDYWEDKGINYRMHPDNIPCLTVANIDYCSLANNHILDWGYSGLAETIITLNKENIKFSGAGKNSNEAEKPAILDLSDRGRVIVFSYGLHSSGIPIDWQATMDVPGVNLLADLSENSVKKIQKKVSEIKQPQDIVVFSVHWGGNWEYEISSEQIKFTHKLIDNAGIDIIHGHSSHHVKGIEVYKDKPIIYGCGDLLNDYEGIGGQEKYRGDLGLMYFLKMEISLKKLIEFQMVPTQIKNFRVNHAPSEDAIWLENTLNRECEQFDIKANLLEDNKLELDWR